MKITFYGYNTFLIESKEKKILIDPGGGLYFFKGWLKSLFPRSKWSEITHIFVTHGDPDHYWHCDRIAKLSGATVLCNKSMVKEHDAESLLLGPRDKGLAFTTVMQNVTTISPFETLLVDEMKITGIHTTHGPLELKLGPFSKTLKPGPQERIGWGSIGFEIMIDNKTIINLGDTLIQQKEWKTIKFPDVLMIPISGSFTNITMNESEALEAIEMFQPKIVIPCHYNCPAFHKKNANPVNIDHFYNEVKKMGIHCAVLQINESIDL